MTRGRDRRAAPEVPRGLADLRAVPDAMRLMLVVALGTLGFNMQDVLLEPYGGEILGLSVSATTLLTASSAMGALVGFWLAARWLGRGHGPVPHGRARTADRASPPSRR